MTEQAVVEYVTNCAWQVPLLAAGAWAMVMLARPSLRTEYWLWVAVLGLAVVLPLRGIGGSREPHTVGPVATFQGRPAIIAAPASGRLLSPEDAALSLREQVAAMRLSLRRFLRGFRLQLSLRATHWFVGLYAAAMLLAVVRLLRAWLRAVWLVRGASVVTLDDAAESSLREASQRMGVPAPEVRASEEIPGPMVVGALRPVLLLPAAVWEYADDELRAALCHELAHVKRRDYLLNFLCEAVMVPVSWHPVANAVERRIQQTREMICDALAAETMESGEGYARCLVSVTRRIMAKPVRFEQTQAVGFFDRNMLEERVMRLTNESEETAMTGRAKGMRVVFGGLALTAVVGVAANLHVRPAFGAEVVTQSAAAAPQANAAPAAAAAAAPAPRPSAAVTAPDSAPHSAPDSGTSVETPVAIARGRHATVTAEAGEYVHRWKSHDGEDFAMVNHEATEPDEDQQQAVEEKLQDTRDAGPALLTLDLPEITLDTKRLHLNQAEIAKAQNLTADPEMKREIAEAQRQLNDPKLRREIEEAQRQVAELKLHPPQIDLSGLNVQLDLANEERMRAMADLKLDQAEINAQVAQGMKTQQEAMKRLNREMESGELNRKLEMAQRTLDEVKRRLEEIQKK